MDDRVLADDRNSATAALLDALALRAGDRASAGALVNEFENLLRVHVKAMSLFSELLSSLHGAAGVPSDKASAFNALVEQLNEILEDADDLRFLSNLTAEDRESVSLEELTQQLKNTGRL